ncbi:MAG TPA: hypothetical protein IAC59_09185 [Candidatus Fimadaptatus faecigallinarum]|uniref:Uncharacterized protein n=1 Tax=Candidatus Fimadaptatus faecigallinarum TaxID=2840814 RepID=A0A9D1LSY1_9FIRM|nr:hypothetical protein [Candidatus Fimadaptatus faecigallinarum]
MSKRNELDLRKAFAAPPESYIAKTRATLESLEEEPVKKFTFSVALALTCALLIMGGALAAGLCGAWNPDNITGQDAQQLSGGQDGFARIAQCVSVDEALFDGRTLYARVTVDPEEWDGTAIVPAPQRYAGMTIDELADSRLSDYDLAVSFRVNGAEQALITGWATAGDATVYEFLYECEPADGALLNVDLSGAFGEGTISVSALNADMNYYSIAQADADGLPALTNGGAVAGDGFAYAQLYFAAGTESERAELLNWLATATLRVDGDAEARISSRVVADGLTLGIMFLDGLPQSFTLNAHGADGVEASATYELSATDVQALSELTRVELPETNDAQPTPEQTGAADTQPTPDKTDNAGLTPNPEQTDAAYATVAPEGTDTADSQPTPEVTGEQALPVEYAGNTTAPTHAMELQTEGQYDGRGLAHIAIEADDANAQLGSVAVNTGDGTQPRLLAMRTERGDDSIRYDLLYQCGKGDIASVRASVDGVAFSMELSAGGTIELGSLYSEADELVGWAVESGGVYFARACLTADEEAYGALADAQIECVDGEDTNMRAELELNGGAWLNVSGYGALPGEMEFIINGARVAFNVAFNAEGYNYYQFDDGRYLYPGAEDVAADEAADAVSSQTAADGGDDTAAIATDELAELLIKLNDSAYDGEYLYVNYELSMPGIYLYDAQLNEINGDVDSPYMPQDGAVAVTQALVDSSEGSVELLWSRAERTGENGGALHYAEVYRCTGAQSLGIYATAGNAADADSNSCSAWLDLDGLEQTDRIRARDVEQLSVPDDLMILSTSAVELNGQLLLGVRYRPSEGDVLTADGINAVTLYGAGEASTTHMVDDGAGEAIWCELYEMYEAVPADGEITLQLERAGGESGEVVLKLLATPELSIVESERNGEYVYALVELTPEDGVQLSYSGELDAAALAGSSSESELYVELNEEFEEYIRNNATAGVIGSADGSTEIIVADGPMPTESADADAASIGVIGGADGSTEIIVSDSPMPTESAETDAASIGVIGSADGSTEIIVADGPMPTESAETDAASIGVIGGADGSTEIIVADGPMPTESAETDAASIGVIGGADGPTSIYLVGNPLPTESAATDGAASIGIIGGADGPTSIYITTPGMSVTMPRLTLDGRDITLGVADMTGMDDITDGALRLMLVGRADGEGQLEVELHAGSSRVAQSLDLPAAADWAESGERVEASAEITNGVEIRSSQTIKCGALKLLEVELDLTGVELDGVDAGMARRWTQDGVDVAICAGDSLPERIWFAGAAAQDGEEVRAYSWRAQWQTDEAGNVDYRVYQLLPGDADTSEVELIPMWRMSHLAQYTAQQSDITTGTAE